MIKSVWNLVCVTYVENYPCLYLCTTPWLFLLCIEFLQAARLANLYAISIQSAVAHLCHIYHLANSFCIDIVIVTLTSFIFTLLELTLYH